MVFKYLSIASVILLLTSCELTTFDSANYADVTVYWSAPIERVNGDAMAFNEIGGYEIRYRQKSDRFYQTILIREPSTEQYIVPNIDPANTIIEVAVFDTDGIYSNFVTAESK